MIDVSDGLLADLGHICETSGVAATVELPRLPLSPAAREAVAGDSAMLAALAAGGDDYELLFAAPPEAADEIVSLSQGLGLPITEIGAIEAGRGCGSSTATAAEIAVETAGGGISDGGKVRAGRCCCWPGARRWR